MVFCCVIKSNHLTRISEAPSRLHPVYMVTSLRSVLHKGLKLKNEVYQYVVRQNWPGGGSKVQRVTQVSTLLLKNKRDQSQTDKLN